MHAAAHLADRVLDADKALAGVVGVGRVAQLALQQVGSSTPPAPGTSRLDAREHRRPALLVDDHMRPLVDQVSSPGRVWLRTQIWFPMAPDGT